MKQTRLLMGMPITAEIVDESVSRKDIFEIFSYFRFVDRIFSSYKKTSEVSQINRGLLSQSEYSDDMKLILSLGQQTKNDTRGYFDVFHNGYFDPAGIVKGWAIYQASKKLRKKGFENFYVDAGGDIETYGKNKEGGDWKVGIRNPFNHDEIVKVVCVTNKGIATSGTYIRGRHIYNPFGSVLSGEVVSVTVIGPNIYEADRFATAVFAMGKEGISFLESQPHLEGYMIDRNGIATFTSGFESYVLPS